MRDSILKSTRMMSLVSFNFSSNFLATSLFSSTSTTSKHFKSCSPVQPFDLSLSALLDLSQLPLLVWRIPLLLQIPERLEDQEMLPLLRQRTVFTLYSWRSVQPQSGKFLSSLRSRRWGERTLNGISVTSVDTSLTAISRKGSRITRRTRKPLMMNKLRTE